MLEAFHLSVLLHQSPPDLPLDQLRDRLRTTRAARKGTRCRSRFLSTFESTLSGYRRRANRAEGWTAGQRADEIPVRRCVACWTTSRSRMETCNPVDWTQEQLSISKLQQALIEQRPPARNISNVPNARVAFEAKALELLASDYPPANVGLLRAAMPHRPRRNNLINFGRLSKTCLTRPRSPGPVKEKTSIMTS